MTTSGLPEPAGKLDAAKVFPLAPPATLISANTSALCQGLDSENRPKEAREEDYQAQDIPARSPSLEGPTELQLPKSRLKTTSQTPANRSEGGSESKKLMPFCIGSIPAGGMAPNPPQPQAPRTEVVLHPLNTQVDWIYNDSESASAYLGSQVFTPFTPYTPAETASPGNCTAQQQVVPQFPLTQERCTNFPLGQDPASLNSRYSSGKGSCGWSVFLAENTHYTDPIAHTAYPTVRRKPVVAKERPAILTQLMARFNVKDLSRPESELKTTAASLGEDGEGEAGCEEEDLNRLREVSPSGSNTRLSRQTDSSEARIFYPKQKPSSCDFNPPNSAPLNPPYSTHNTSMADSLDVSNPAQAGNSSSLRKSSSDPAFETLHARVQALRRGEMSCDASPHDNIQGIILGGPLGPATHQGSLATRGNPELVFRPTIPSMHGVIGETTIPSSSTPNESALTRDQLEAVIDRLVKHISMVQENITSAIAAGFEAIAESVQSLRAEIRACNDAIGNLNDRVEAEQSARLSEPNFSTSPANVVGPQARMPFSRDASFSTKFNHEDRRARQAVRAGHPVNIEQAHPTPIRSQYGETGFYPPVNSPHQVGDARHPQLTPTQPRSLRGNRRGYPGRRGYDRPNAASRLQTRNPGSNVPPTTPTRSSSRPAQYQGIQPNCSTLDTAVRGPHQAQLALSPPPQAQPVRQQQHFTPRPRDPSNNPMDWSGTANWYRRAYPDNRE
ncbi:hypothetical protein FQN57_003723 [Myotisia sp. PD_48]|nr:hypothetical protein FQN57_003723 [Myotisia sp. PD_48]